MSNLYIKCPVCRGKGKVDVKHPRGHHAPMICQICENGYMPVGLNESQVEAMHTKVEAFRDLYYQLSDTPSSGLQEIAKQIAKILKIEKDG